MTHVMLTAVSECVGGTSSWGGVAPIILSLLHGSLLFLTQHFPSFSRFGPCLPPIVTLLVRSPSIGWDCYWLPTWHCVSSLPLRHSVVHDVILFHISGSRTHTDDNTALFYICLCYRTQDDWHCNAILYFPLGFPQFFYYFFFTLFRISSTFLPKFLPAQSKELHTIDRQEEKNNRKRKSLTIFSLKERDRDIVSQINVETASKATIEKRLRDEVERTAFPDHVDIILNWTELHWTVTLFNISCLSCRRQ